MTPMSEIRSADAPLDDVDAALATARMAEFDSVTGPRLGDIVRFDDGRERRLAVMTQRGGFQTCGMRACSFFLYGTTASPSGSMDIPTLTGRLEDTGETAFAEFWIFHHGDVGPGRRRNFLGRVRVFRYA